MIFNLTLWLGAVRPAGSTAGTRNAAGRTHGAKPYVWWADVCDTVVGYA